MNIPHVETIRKHGHTVVCISCSEGRLADGAVWSVFDVDRDKLVKYGTSMGWDGQGAGSMLEASKVARKRAHDYLRKFKPKSISDAQDQD